MRKLIALAAALALCAPALFAETAITVRAGGKTMRGILYDTPLAREIAARFPLTVAMSGWGGREFYGSPDFTPATKAEGRLRFDDGDITYCAQNNSLAIFYAQTDRPDLTMKVVPIGKITSNLDVFGTLGSRAEFTFEIEGR